MAGIYPTGTNISATPKGNEPLVANVDPKNIFTVTNLNGEGVIHVSGDDYGAITTRDEFTNFHFRIQFQWGLARYGGRANVGRDSGILYCGIGQPNPRTGWMTSVENNIMEKGVGQWWSVNGAIIDCEGEWITEKNELYIPYKKEGKGEKNIVWKKGGLASPHERQRHHRPIRCREVFGNWNTVEVVFWGGQCIHILNGHVNLVAFNPRYQDGDLWRPLTHGKIQLQSEGRRSVLSETRDPFLYELPAEFLGQVVSPVGGRGRFHRAVE